MISIHALRTEGDSNREVAPFRSILYFYPRPPYGGRPGYSAVLSGAGVFLSTPSVRRATALAWALSLWYRNFYPRPPYGGRRDGVFILFASHNISIHALRTEGDWSVIFKLQQTGTFLSTPSVRRATVRSVTGCPSSSNFYPRPPYGGRPLGSAILMRGSTFLSTPSVRRATRRTFQNII